MTLHAGRRLRAFVVAVGLVVVLPLVATGQSRATPWGDPDLQGVWDYWTFTPLERADEFAGRDTLTAEEAAIVGEAGRAAARATDRDGPGNPGAYGQEVWTERSRATALTQPSLIVDPPDGKIPALTASETNRVAAHQSSGGRPVRTRAGGIGVEGAEDRGLAERCIVGFSTGPPMLPAGYNNNVQVLQAPGYVALVVEMIHDVRVIPVTGAAHADEGVELWMGDARAHWEGDTLVVDTTNFNDRTMIVTSSRDGRLKGLPVGDAMHVVERFTRMSEDEIMWEVTVDDPDVYDRPWTLSMPLTRATDYVMYEYACHEGNQDVAIYLGGGRGEELTSR